jgi:hypothetical protein
MPVLPQPWQSPTNFVRPAPQIVLAVPRLFLPAGALGPPSLDGQPIFTRDDAPAPAPRRIIAHGRWKGPRDAMGNPILIDPNAPSSPSASPSAAASDGLWLGVKPLYWGVGAGAVLLVYLATRKKGRR